jgi:hypothetical protein
MVGKGRSYKKMKSPMTPGIHITESADEIPLEEVGTNEAHQLSVEGDADNKDVYLSFSSRLAMYDFARSLLHEALYGRGGMAKFYPLEYEGKREAINGVRMSPDSARLFVFYQDDVSPEHPITEPG